MSSDDEAPPNVYLAELDAIVLTGVAGHPYELPTLPELAFVAGVYDEAWVQRRVERLVVQSVLETVSFYDEPPCPDSPSTFYGLTERGERVLEWRLGDGGRHELQTTYAHLEKPTEIRKLERAPRPSR